METSRLAGVPRASHGYLDCPYALTGPDRLDRPSARDPAPEVSAVGSLGSTQHLPQAVYDVVRQAEGLAHRDDQRRQPGAPRRGDPAAGAGGATAPGMTRRAVSARQCPRTGRRPGLKVARIGRPGRIWSAGISMTSCT